MIVIEPWKFQCTREFMVCSDYKKQQRNTLVILAGGYHEINKHELFWPQKK